MRNGIMALFQGFINQGFMHLHGCAKNLKR